MRSVALGAIPSWKGSFAKDTLLGWEERVRTAGLGDSASRTAGRYAGGSFWKRFDEIKGEELKGHVVNYELHFLPGKPVVRKIAYPDNNRKYFTAGDDALLLTYTNEPYRIVYDLIKVIDANNCIGVMHLGKFPTGMELLPLSWRGRTIRSRKCPSPTIRQSSAGPCPDTFSRADRRLLAGPPDLPHPSRYQPAESTESCCFPSSVRPEG